MDKNGNDRSAFKNKRLYFMRHAIAEQPNGVIDDFDRPLSVEGKAQADRAGIFFEQDFVSENIIPNNAYILCSSAVRTRQTWDNVAAGRFQNGLKVEYLDELYNANASRIFECVSQVPLHFEVVVVVAHYPGIWDAAVAFNNEQTPVLVRQQLSSGYFPASVTVVECGVSWKNISQHVGVSAVESSDSRVVEHVPGEEFIQ